MGEIIIAVEIQQRTKELQNPRERFASPPFPQGKQNGSGSSEELTPKADYGEATYVGHGKLRGRAALITGADSGIGRAVALCFAKEGTDILFTFLPEEHEDANETVRLVEAAGRKAIAHPGDMREKEFCKHLIEATVEESGRLDILVNNAAFQRTHESLEDIEEEEFDRTFRTNVYATFFLTQASLPKMQPGAVIINTCWIEAYQPAESLVAYADTMQGVRVNGVTPWTGLHTTHSCDHA